MAQSLGHRGPDGEGIFVGDTVGLGHRRLAIVDRENGSQPLSRPAPGGVASDALVLVANAEIYNHAALRTALTERGHSFRTRSDVEVILHGYAEWGDAVVDHLRGMFAFALWDGARRRLLLARDRFGEKPLYYRRDRKRLEFASQPRALFAGSAASPEIDSDALSLYLALDHVPSPHSLLRGIRKLGAGERLVAEKGAIRVERYWSFATTPKTTLSYEEAEDQLRRRLDEAVSLQLQADVPVGVFLSGGLDSTLVAATAARLGHRIPAFSVGFDDGDGYDETAHSRDVATALGLPHHVVRLDALRAEALMHEAAEAFDEPVADPAVLPTLLLSRFARGQVGVALSGDGADELFAGYDTFLAARLDAATRSWDRLKTPAAGLAAALWPERGGYFSTAFRLRQFAAGFQRPPSERAIGWMLTRSGREIEKLRGEASSTTLLDRLLEALPVSGDPVDDTSVALVRLYLEGALLPKVDRAAMWTGLEVRAPFLDHGLAELAATLPSGWKLRGLQRKWILKKSFADRLGPAIHRPKQGFSVPVGEWMNGRLRSTTDAILLDPAAYRVLPIDRNEVIRLLSVHRSGRVNLRKPLWNLVTLFLWAERWLARSPSRELSATSVS